MSAALLNTVWFYIEPLILTAAIEAGVAALLKFNKKEQLALLLSNSITNPALNLIIGCVYALGGPYAPAWLLILLEAAIVAAEAALIPRLTSGLGGACTRKSYVLPSIILNAASYFIGTALLMLI